jgi:uncharacterized protein (TIGR00725 family)
VQKELIVSVFGSSRPREEDSQYVEARLLGRTLAERGFAVCTGAYAGTMEAVSRGAKDAGGKTYGVTADFFAKAKANQWIDVEIRVKTWQDRLFEIIKMGDGFVALQGGTGTMAELAVAWEMMNKAVILPKPFVALGKFWHPILKCVRDVEGAGENPWAEGSAKIVESANTSAEAVELLARGLKI